MYHYFPCEVNKGFFGISSENTLSGLPLTFFDENTSLACGLKGFLIKVYGSPDKVFPLEIPKSLWLPCKVVTNSHFLILYPRSKTVFIDETGCREVIDLTMPSLGDFQCCGSGIRKDPGFSTTVDLDPGFYPDADPYIIKRKISCHFLWNKIFWDL